MTTIDYCIILLYFIGLVLLGWTLSKRIKNSKDLFIAGRRSSWWLSGLSTYMTLFSAGTFVVWGGLAFSSGLVAITINLTVGISSLLVGKFISARWARMRIDSPAEYLSIRFDKSLVKFYTVIGLIGRGVHVGISLYAISILTVSLIPLPADNFFCDPATGHLAVYYAIPVLGIITLIYTAAGGFIAVLMTDAVQFAVLTALVLIMVPLSLQAIGGIDHLFTQAPEHYFSMFNDRYTWGWMILWCCLNFFVIGGDWQYVQRYISTPTGKDAKKNSYLVGILYLITPVIWLIPSMAYRIYDPGANPEQSYMLMGQHVLGAGTIGLLLAAMISATLSTVSGTLNVFANVITYDFFRTFRPGSSEKTLISVGRTFTYLFGIFIIVIAVLIPRIGGAENATVWVLTAIIPPLFIPSLWGLFSKKLTAKSVWLTLIITYLIAFVLRMDLLPWDFIQNHKDLVNAFNGFAVPAVILLVIEWSGKNSPETAGWLRLSGIYSETSKMPDPDSSEKNRKLTQQYSLLAFKLIMGTFAAIGSIIILMCFVEGDFHMLYYGILFLVIPLMSLVIYYFHKKR